MIQRNSPLDASALPLAYLEMKRLMDSERSGLAKALAAFGTFERLVFGMDVPAGGGRGRGERVRIKRTTGKDEEENRGGGGERRGEVEK